MISPVNFLSAKMNAFAKRIKAGTIFSKDWILIAFEALSNFAEVTYGISFVL